MTKKDYQSVSHKIPHGPGVYRFIDNEGTVLYVGKAKNLKNRIGSYFTSGRSQMNKTRVMVKHAKEFKFTLVETEADAYLLENSLVKKHQPRYNVELKDGKSYTYLCIKNEPFPRVFFTRKLIKDGSTYFGPYTSKWRTKVLLDLIKDLFQIRTCNLDLSEEMILKKDYKVCLEYHIENCKGPCIGLENQEDYDEKIEQIKNILKGNFGPVREHLNYQMQLAAKNLQFEKAQRWKNKLIAFKDYQAKSTVSNIRIKDVDVFTAKTDGKDGFVHYLKILNGAIINTYTAEIQLKMDESKQDLLSFAIPRIREKFNSQAPEVYLSDTLEDFESEEFEIVVPKIGDKRKLVELSQKNLFYYINEWKRDKLNKEKKVTASERILRTLQKDLDMDTLPYHIECFDNSNLQGSHPVASCVVFKNAKPSKKDYRKFNIKTVEGPDDFASMTEIIGRRYGRMLREGENLPQLVIIDGGKGQLSAAMKSIRDLDIEDKLTVIGIAKKLEEIFFPDDPIPIYINKKSESLKLIQQARNEAHRFAISFHRDQRSRKFTRASLEDIQGIGHKTADKLLRRFRSVKRIREADISDLQLVVGSQKANIVYQYFQEEE